MMCLIRLSAATPHADSKNFNILQELLPVALQNQKFKTAHIPGFSLQSGAKSPFDIHI